MRICEFLLEITVHSFNYQELVLNDLEQEQEQGQTSVQIYVAPGPEVGSTV